MLSVIVDGRKGFLRGALVSLSRMSCPTDATFSEVNPAPFFANDGISEHWRMELSGDKRKEANFR